MKRILVALVITLAGGVALASGIDPFGPTKDERLPMRIHQTVPIVFPNTLIARGITSGDASVAISMDNTGKLTDVLVVGYTEKEFADAAEQAIRLWDYEPIRVRDEHVATQAIINFSFEAKGVVISIDANTDLNAHILSFRQSRGFAPCPLEKLDRIPTPIDFAEPVYTRDLALHGVRGQAVIEFYIDENGTVRVPAVIDADFWELGVLAMEAVRQWRFERPTSRGHPVLVHVRQSFYFGPLDKAS